MRATAASPAPTVAPDAADLVRRARRFEARALRADTSSGQPDAAPDGVRDPFGAVTDRPAADTARLLFDSAALRVPAVHDWLSLRALALEPDDRRRTARAARLALTVVRDRVMRADATARARFGDAEGAARRLASADPVAALQLRLRDTLPTTVDSVRRALLDLVRAGGPAAGRAAAVAAARWPSLGADDRLVVARALAGGAPRRALALLDTLRGAGTLPARDLGLRAELAARVSVALVAAQAWEDAAREGDPAARRWARAQQGRQLVRAERDSAATAVLLAVAGGGVADSASALAHWLLGDRAAAADHVDEAREHFAELVRTSPTSPLAPRAAFTAAMLLLGRNDSLAAAEFDAAASRWPAAPEAIGALYWAGRATSAVGDTAAAIARWRRVLDGDATSYHAALAARRLGVAVTRPPVVRRLLPLPDVSAAVDRMAQLEALGLMSEAAHERAALVAAAGDDTARLLAAAAALVASPRPGLGIALAERAVQGGAPADAAVLRLVYPWPYAAQIRSEAARRGVDPALAAALIRQESRFTADAVSSAGARGVMQLMPATAAMLARADGRRWSPALLDDPTVNIALGMRHLAGELARWPATAYALAAYNAGGARVARWRQRRGHDDPELFTERIPFTETREYVRTIVRTRAIYAALWGDATSPGGAWR